MRKNLIDQRESTFDEGASENISESIACVYLLMTTLAPTGNI